MEDTQFVSVSIPESLSDIKLSTYKKFLMMANEDNGDEQALYHFCGLAPAVQESMKKKDRDYIRKKLGEVLNEKPSLTNIFKFKGVEYGFHPKLEDISMGEYIDLEEYLKEPYKNAEKVLGILYRPITNKVFGRYNVENYNPDKHNGIGFQDLGANIFLGCLLFFYRLEISLLITFLRSSQKEEEMNQPSISKLSSQENGVGMAQSIRLLEAISLNLMK
jgi:hypothetical protein